MMEDQNSFGEVYTVTMAGIYEEQGHFAKAAEVYRKLLERDPDNKQLRQALARVMESAEKNTEKQRIEDLFRSWIDLCMKYNAIRQLNALGYGRRYRD